MNDDLQSSSVVQQDRATAVDDRNLLVEAILSSVRAGIVVVSSDLRVRVWSRWAEEQWGIRADEAVGVPFDQLDIGLPTHEVAALVAAMIADGDPSSPEREILAVNRRGQRVRVRVNATPLLDGGARDGAVLVLEDSEE